MPTYPRSEIDAILAQGRRDITALSQPAVDAFIRAFSTNLNILIQRYAELEEQAKAGSKSADQLRRDLLPIKRQAEADFAYWQTVASDALDDTVRASWASGVGMATRLVEAKQIAGAITPMFGTFNRLAYEAQYISTQAGPVRRLLQSIASNSTENAVDVLRNAMMEGINPRKTAVRLAQATSADLTRCEVIARTESARAHKEGTLARYMEADVEYVKWMSAEQMRTCPACWAMDGRVYAIDKVPNDHPNGRCVTEPMLDEEVEEARGKYGDDWQGGLWNENIAKNTGIMGKMSDEQLMHIFGSQRQIDAFRAGAPLQDAVKMVSNRTWGISPSVQALKHPGTSPSSPTTTKPPVKPKPPVAPPKPVAPPPSPPKPVVDWKHNLPDEWTPCDVKTAQQRINDMLSINDDVWGTVDKPHMSVMRWSSGRKVEKLLKTKGRSVVGGEVNIDKLNHVGDMALRYFKMCDELNIPRPAYFNMGHVIGPRNAGGDCGSGINVYKNSFLTFMSKRGPVEIVKDVATGEVRYVDTVSNLLAPNTMLSNGGQVANAHIHTVDHEFGHFLGHMFSKLDSEPQPYDKLHPSTMLKRSTKVLNVTRTSGISAYGKTNLLENLAETWAAFVNYGREGVGTAAAARFDEIGWTKAAQNAGVIKWK